MRKGAIGILALTGALVAGAGLHWLTDTCRPLDRLLGLSGCAQTVVVSGFNPLRGVAMSTPDSGQVASLFGWSMTADGWRPSMVHVDLHHGAEQNRFPIRALNGFGYIVLDEAEQEALLTCMGSGPCIEEGSSGAIVSLDDGAIVRPVVEPASFTVNFPGEKAPDPETFGVVAHYAAAGERVVSIVSAGDVELYTGAGEQVATLLSSDKRDRWSLRGLAVSPSGSYIAMLNESREPEPPQLYVWDAVTGETLYHRTLPSDYRLGTSPAWMKDETGVALMRRQGPDTYIDVFTLAAR